MQTFLQTLREEYLTRLEKARSEIHRKVEILESKKRQQQGQLIKLRGEKKELTSKAAALSETYQDLQVKSKKVNDALKNCNFVLFQKKVRGKLKSLKTPLKYRQNKIF